MGKPRDPEAFWKGVAGASLLAGFLILWPTLGRITDGDDALYHYSAGLKDWGDVLRTSFLPQEHPALVFSRWRPMATELFPKLFWELDLGVAPAKVLSWFLFWLNHLAFAWGMVRALRLALPLAQGSVLAITSLVWLCAPGLVLTSFITSGSFGPTAGHLAVGLLCGTGKGSRRILTVAGAGLLAFMSFQSYEAYWFYFVWLGMWLLALRGLGRSAPRAAPFWVPWLMVAAHILIYRRILPEEGALSGQNPERFIYSLDPQVLASGFSYFALTVLNGLAKPLTALATWRAPNLDTTPAEAPWAFGLTCAAIWLGARSAKKARSRTEWGIRSPAFWAAATLAAAALLTSAPYWSILNFRFIYFVRIPAGLLSVLFVAWLGRGKLLPRAPVILLLVANAWSSAQALSHWNWLEMNFRTSMGFYEEVMAKPGFKECTSESPCCVGMRERKWGMNEWTLSWISGAPKRPPYYPEGWPGAPCPKHLTLD